MENISFGITGRLVGLVVILFSSLLILEPIQMVLSKESHILERYLGSLIIIIYSFIVIIFLIFLFFSYIKYDGQLIEKRTLMTRTRIYNNDISSIIAIVNGGSLIHKSVKQLSMDQRLQVPDSIDEYIVYKYLEKNNLLADPLNNLHKIIIKDDNGILFNVYGYYDSSRINDLITKLKANHEITITPRFHRSNHKSIL